MLSHNLNHIFTRKVHEKHIVLCISHNLYLICFMSAHGIIIVPSLFLSSTLFQKDAMTRRHHFNRYLRRAWCCLPLTNQVERQDIFRGRGGTHISTYLFIYVSRYPCIYLCIHSFVYIYICKYSPMSICVCIYMSTFHLII